MATLLKVLSTETQNTMPILRIRNKSEILELLTEQNTQIKTSSIFFSSQKPIHRFTSSQIKFSHLYFQLLMTQKLETILSTVHSTETKVFFKVYIHLRTSLDVWARRSSISSRYGKWVGLLLMALHLFMFMYGCIMLEHLNGSFLLILNPFYVRIPLLSLISKLIL